MKKLFKEQLLDIGEKIKSGVSAYKLADEYSVCHQTIYMHFKSLIENIKIQNNKIRDDLIIKEFIKNPNILEISKKIGHTQALISRIIKTNGLSPIKINKHSLIHQKNENFFEIIDSEEKAYFLGFLYADGCVTVTPNHKRKSSIRYCVSIGLKHLNQYILQKLSNLIFDKDLTKIYHYKNDKYEPESNLTIYSKKMCEDLIKLGCVPRKSLILKFPSFEQVPEYLIADFIRGFFDGDGCVSLVRNKKDPFFVDELIFLLVQVEIFVKGLKSFFIEKLGIKCNVCYYRRNDWGTLQFMSKDSVVKFSNFIYNDCFLFLFRKKNKILEYINKLNCHKMKIIPFYDGNSNIKLNKRDKWECRISFRGEKIYIGTFSSKDEAIEKYNEKAIELSKLIWQ